MTIYGQLTEQGQFRFGEPDNEKFKQFRLKHAGKKIVMTLEVETRSTKQFCFYWKMTEAMLYYIKDEYDFDNNKDNLHAWLEEQYAVRFAKDKIGVIKIRGRQTTRCTFSVSYAKCSQSLFQNYMDFIDSFVSEFTCKADLEDMRDSYSSEIEFIEKFDWKKKKEERG